ncbi:amino acid permease [Hirsutella rhossiliensis]|uniref:Amino acid permease domain-containing protein n=1 Tax=Hirsutella rhossiliensis TaxID=111463 RepID=A0A9P8SJE0_9HYPO|nr:amino acid permease domain-containing protein [Hirsutella rhossiliensis]KAH0964801.1 amino acid permease domain-containing protein [Hirsutella rhossiliensis]
MSSPPSTGQPQQPQQQQQQQRQCQSSDSTMAGEGREGQDWRKRGPLGRCVDVDDDDDVNDQGRRPDDGASSSMASQARRDADDLAALGHVQVLTRKFSTWSMLALAFTVLGTWTTCAQGLNNGLVNGGPVAILWGLVLVALCNTCVAVSLGELCSSMPTALGQAYWIARLADKAPAARFASYLCAWINTFGWWTLAASQIAFMSDFILAMRLMFLDDDAAAAAAPPGWLRFLVYLAITLAFTLFNLVACRRESVLPAFNNFVGVGFVALFLVFVATLPAAVATHSGLSFRRPSFVFAAWLNRTGWPDAVTWFLGLVQSAYGLTAFDSVIHMVEEIPAPRRNAPRTMYLAVVCGALSGFLFMLVCLFCIQDLERLLSPPSGFPFIEITQSTVGLSGAAALIALFIFNGLGQGVSILTSASRLTWSFARDGGIPFGAFFAHVDPQWRVPARALWLQAALISLVGLLYLFANTVLQAILSVSTIALTMSYAMPILALVLVGRDKMPPREFNLGRLGPPINAVSLVYCAVTTVFFFFPSQPNPRPGDMNFAIAVFGVMLVVALGFWVVQGRLTFLQTGGDVLYANNLATGRDVLADDGATVTRTRDDGRNLTKPPSVGD